MHLENIAMRKKYEFIDHTADTGFKAYGATCEDLFAHAAEALFEVIVDRDSLGEKEERVIEVDADALDNLMVNWLGKLLFMFDTEGLLLKRFAVRIVADYHIRAIVVGEIFDPASHEIKTGIKAVTYYKLYVRKNNSIWEAQVILDL